MAVALGLVVSVPKAMADVSITWSGSGSHSVLENEIVNQKRQITLYGEGLSAVIATITATSGTEPIRYIHVRSKDVAGGTSAVVVNVVQGGGTVSSIETMAKDPNYTSTGEFWIGTVNISGTLGIAGTAEGGSITADYVSALRALGDLNAATTIGQRTVGGYSLQ